REFTGLFVAIGHSPRSELLAGQISLDGEGYVQVEGRSTRTNLKGVFACGDLVDHTYRGALVIVYQLESCEIGVKNGSTISYSSKFSGRGFEFR
ncbi:MAG: hypothetical protein RL534_710, partial [Actinomycetota bacterium]